MSADEIQPEFPAKDESLRVVVADVELLKQIGYRQVTTSLRDHAKTLALLGGSRGARRTANAWASVLDAAISGGKEA